MIQLRNKGPLQPAPQLPGFAQRVSTEVQSWTGIISATHWKLGDATRVDGAEFHVEGRGELGHIHLHGEVHVYLNVSLRNELVKCNLARPLVWDSAWVIAPITSPEEADQAIWLLRLGYDRLNSTPDETLFQQVKTRVNA